MAQIEETGQYLTTEFDALPLIPQEVANEVIKGITETSATLSLFRRLPNMSSRTLRMPVLNSMGAASFISGTVDDSLTEGADFEPTAVTGETGVPGLKDTHQMAWKNVYINAEPLAIILPIGEDVLEDSQYPIWDEIQPRIEEAFGIAIDNAVIWGQKRPTSWPSGIVPTAISRGFTFAEGTGADLGEDASELMGVLEAVGYNPTGWIIDPTAKKDLRNLRDSNGNPLFAPSLRQGDSNTFWGLPIEYVRNGTMRSNAARFIVGDMNQAVYSIRTDMRFKLFTEGVITDSTGAVVANLMQNDMVALRVVMRLGWAVPNPIHALGTNRATKYPFAVMTT
jgi:HK97 family phage major capsid protein